MKYLLNCRSFISLMILFSFSDNFGTEIKKDYDYLFKVLFVGDAAVGKTQIFNRYFKKNFLEDYKLTVGMDFANKEVNFENKKIKLQVWDSSGLERFRNITQIYYRNSHLIAFVYAINDRNSFENIPNWVKEVKTQNKDAKFLLVGNKCDLKKKQREVTTEEAKKYAEDNNMKFFEVSAKTGEGINDMFNYIISELLKEKEPGLFDNQYKNDIKFNKTSCLNEYCSCCPCLEKSEWNVEKQEEIQIGE